MDLISKGMYPGSLEIDKDRKTDYSCSHWGRVRWRLPSSFWTLCSNKSDIVWIQWKPGERTSCLVPWKPLFSWSLRAENAALRLGRQCSGFLLPHIVILWLLFVRLHSCCSGLLTKNSSLSFSGYNFFFSHFQTLPGEKKLLRAYSAPSPSIQVTGFSWSSYGLGPTWLAV